MLSLALLVFIKRAIAAENMPHLIACVVVVSVAWGYELSRGEMFQQCDGEAARSAMLYEHTPDGLERTYVHAIHASLFWMWGFVAVVISVLVAFVYRHFGWQTFSVVSRLRLSLAAYRLLQWQRAATEWSIFVCLLYTAATALDTTFYRAQGIVSAQARPRALLIAHASQHTPHRTRLTAHASQHTPHSTRLWPHGTSSPAGRHVLHHRRRRARPFPLPPLLARLHATKHSLRQLLPALP